jgi:glycerol-3-phosphate cytidylyltransferase
MYDKTKTNQIKSTLSGKIGVMFSCWDLLHPGHILALKEAASLCDHLIVGLHVNPQLERPEKNEPIIDLAGRKIMLEGCKYINNYIEYETEADLYQILLDLTPSVRFLGTDYVNKKFTGEDLLIPIHYIDRSHNYSSSNLRTKIAQKTHK